MRTSTKITAVVGGAALTLATAGVAFAYWTQNGTGSGNAVNASAKDGAITLTATVPAGLAPGTGGAVSFAASNSSTTTDGYVASLKVTSITANQSCSVADFSFVSDSASTTSLVNTAITENTIIPAGGASTALPTGGYLKFANSASNQDNCKGATITLNLTSV